MQNTFITQRKIYILQAPVLIAIIITFINDHYLKYSSFSGTLTGKISDYSGIFFFPFLILDLILTVKKQDSFVSRRKIFISLLVFSGFCFVLLKTNDAFIQLYVEIFSFLTYSTIKVTKDFKDLQALSSLVFAYIFFRRVHRC